MTQKKIFVPFTVLALILACIAPVAPFCATAAYADTYYVDTERETTQNPDLGNGTDDANNDEERVDPSKDGKYYVNVDLWHASDNNKSSMGNVAFEHKALVITSGGGSVIQVATHPVEVSGYTTAITEVENARTIQSGSFTTNTKYDGTQHSITYLKVFELNLPNTSSSYLPTRIKVPYTPMDAVGAATDGWLSARLRIYWNSAVSAESSAALDPSTSVVSGTSTLDTTEAPAVSLSDGATGVKLTAPAGTIPADAELKVTAITGGADFTKTETALKEALATEETPKFKLYDISLIQSKVEIQPNGTVTVSIPIPSDYDKAKVVLYRINDDGTATLIKGKVSGGNYEIALNKLSLYALVEGEKIINELDTPLDVSTFTDIAGHWALDAIRFVVENGLFNGTSETTFSPNTAMDRGMFVTVLGRLAGIDAASYTATPFTDVKAGTYYAPYAAWASENKIVEGVGNGLFAPANQITRQEMATMLNRYVNFAGIRLSSEDQVTFADDTAIASWAKDGVYSLAFAGVLNGVGEGNYAPAKTATRAEVATMLTRFARLSPVTQ